MTLLLDLISSTPKLYGVPLSNFRALSDPAAIVWFVPSETVRYTYRLRPGAHAVAALLAEWHRSRWIWNQCVAAARDKRAWIGDKDLTAARARVGWLRDGSVVVQQQTIRTFKASKGRKKFKHEKRALPTLNYTLRGFAIRDGRLRLAGGLSIPVVWSRDLPAPPSSVRVYRDSLGHWYASFVVVRTIETLPTLSAALGVDWGVSTIATASEPEYDLPHPTYGKNSAGALAKYQKRMARRKPAPGKLGSRGYKHAKRQTAKLHKKVARQRQDTARKWVRRVVAEHQRIAVEDFKPKFLAKSTLARKSADAAIAATKNELVDYARRAGREVVLVPPAYTTMTCSNPSCFARAKQRLDLSQRTFACAECGYTADRDRNAARVILALAGFDQADVDAVRQRAVALGPLLVAS